MELAMRIIQKGREIPKEHEILCRRCDTRFAVTKSDCEYVERDPRDQRDDAHFTVNCPTCGEKQYIKRMVFEY